MSRVYYSFIVVMILFNGLIWITPLLAQTNTPGVSVLYSSFSNICHQLTARSFCLYESGVGDCITQNGVFSASKANVVLNEQGIGYKFPVDARDMAIYATMLIAGLALPFVLDKRSNVIPNMLILVAAAAPVGIDGFTQLLGWRESTNGIRIITGLILGAAIPFFLIPTVNFFVKKFSKKKQIDFNLGSVKNE